MAEVADLVVVEPRQEVGLVAVEPSLVVVGLVEVELQPPHGSHQLVLAQRRLAATATATATDTAIAHHPPPLAGLSWR